MSFVGNYKTMETFQFQDELAMSIFEICKIVPFGVLCFLPSYAFMDKLLKRLELTGLLGKINSVKRIFTEPQQGTTKQFESLMKRYYECINGYKNKGISVVGKDAGITGGLFFAVYRGKISEGMDLTDDNARAVIPVGIPYPAFKDQKVILKREFNDLHCVSKKILSGHAWYETQAFRALNQALGRCIRHRLDWGAIILLEQRFTIHSNVNQLSKWVRSQVKTFHDFAQGMSSLEQFVIHNRAREVETADELRLIQDNLRHEDAVIVEDDY